MKDCFIFYWTLFWPFFCPLSVHFLLLIIFKECEIGSIYYFSSFHLHKSDSPMLLYQVAEKTEKVFRKWSRGTSGLKTRVGENLESLLQSQETT